MKSTKRRRARTCMRCQHSLHLITCNQGTVRPMCRKMTAKVNTSAMQAPGAEHRLYMRFSVQYQVHMASCRRVCPLHKLRQLSKHWLQRARALRAGRHQQTHAALCPDSGQIPWRPILVVCSILLLHFSQSSLRAHFCKITFAPVAVHVKLELKAGLQRPKQ